MLKINHRGWGYLLVVIAVFIAYGGSIDNGFTYDDRGLVLEDPRIVIGDWGAIVTQSYWGDKGDGLYRPLTTASLALTWLVCKDQPWLYHLVNLLLHALAGAMLLYVVQRQVGYGIGVVAALLFALHPGPSEAVFSIVGRAELLACCWGLGAVICSLAARTTAGVSVRWLVGGFICLLASMLSKENGLAFACGLLLGEIICNRRIGWIGGMAILAATVAALVKWVAIGAFEPEGIGYLDNPLAYGTADLRFAQGFGLVVRGVAKLVFPWPLVADYSPQQIPLYDHWLEMGIIWPILLTLSLGWGVLIVLKAKATSGLWLGISGGALLITSNIFVTTGTIFAERLLYMPAIGLCLGWGWCLSRLDRRWLVGITSVWLAMAGGILWVRGGEWQSDRALFASVVDKHPLSARGHYGLGLAWHRGGELNKAVTAYERAIALYPRYLEAEFNKGGALVEMGLYDTAVKAYQRVLALRPNHFKARYTLSLLEAERGNINWAETTLRQLYKERATRSDILHSLVTVLMRRGNSAAAVEMIAMGLERDPLNDELRQLQQALKKSQARD